VACIVKSLLYACALRNVLFGTASWMRMSRASNPAHQEKDQRGDSIKKADSLVIDRREPAHEASLGRWPREDLSGRFSPRGRPYR
jgi:hypothetical protein